VRQSEKDLRTITDTIRQFIVVLAPDGTTLYVNQVALDLTGYTKDQLDEQGFWARVVHPDDVKRLAAPLFAHRVVINTRTTLVQRRADMGERIIEEILSQVEVPL